VLGGTHQLGAFRIVGGAAGRLRAHPELAQRLGVGTTSPALEDQFPKARAMPEGNLDGVRHARF
jgi:hypothetical protein